MEFWALYTGAKGGIVVGFERELAFGRMARLNAKERCYRCNLDGNSYAIQDWSNPDEHSRI